MATADVFIDPVFDGQPGSRRSASGGRFSSAALRQGGAGYYALDVTQPDDIVTGAGPTQGEIVGSKDASPRCLERQRRELRRPGRPRTGSIPRSSGNSPTPARTAPTPAARVAAALGETWSRPVVGRIRIFTGSGGRAAVRGPLRRHLRRRIRSELHGRRRRRGQAAEGPGLLHRGRRDRQDPLQDDRRVSTTAAGSHASTSPRCRPPRGRRLRRRRLSRHRSTWAT